MHVGVQQNQLKNPKKKKTHDTQTRSPSYTLVWSGPFRRRASSLTTTRSLSVLLRPSVNYFYCSRPPLAVHFAACGLCLYFYIFIFATHTPPMTMTESGKPKPSGGKPACRRQHGSTVHTIHTYLTYIFHAGILEKKRFQPPRPPFLLSSKLSFILPPLLFRS